MDRSSHFLTSNFGLEIWTREVCEAQRERERHTVTYRFPFLKQQFNPKILDASDFFHGWAKKYPSDFTQGSDPRSSKHLSGDTGHGGMDVE